MSQRSEVLAQLRDWAFTRSGHWVLWFRESGRVRPWRIPWPESQSGREDAWATLTRILQSAKSDGEIRARLFGTPRGQATVFAWPHPEDLFTASDPPATPAPAEATRDASGQERKVEIEGLSVQLVNLVAPPRKYSPQCAQAILQLLYDTQKRHTGMDLVIAFDKSVQHHGWCQASIEASASYLRKIGAIDNIRDGKGTGYGLVKWDTNPVGVAE